MNVRHVPFRIWAVILGLVIPSVGRGEPSQPWAEPLSAGRINLGVHFGDQQAESFGDILVPVIATKDSLIFVNTRGSWNDDDGQEFNFGAGYRRLFPDRGFIVGGTLFYDLRNTSLDNTCNQLGFGMEFLGQWIDLRVNAYLPLDGKQTTDKFVTGSGRTQEHNSYWYEPAGQGYNITQYGYDITTTYDVKTLQHYQMTEQAMEGFDGEIGSLLPLPVVKDYADIKVFVGYYNYNAHYGNDISGMKGRLEIKPVPALCLDAAWFEDKALIGSRYSAGIRASVPCDLANLSRGKNPFAGALDGFKPGGGRATVASRMTEMVMRDLHIRTDVSRPVEVVSDRRELSRTVASAERKDYSLVLVTGVTFVDDDNRSGLENGTWENPFRQINTGIQNAVGTMVYVRDAERQYQEQVVMRSGMTLWGSGAPIYGQGNRFMGGVYPVVNGMGRGPAITLASHVTLTGFEVVQHSSTQATNPYSWPWNNVGLFGDGVTDVSIRHNYIHGHGQMDAGIFLRALLTSSFGADISGNRIADISGNGIACDILGVSDVNIILSDNVVTRCEGSGVVLSALGGDRFRARVSGDYSGNGRSGILADLSAVDLIDASFSNVRTDDNRSGLRVGVDSLFGDINLAIDHVMATGNHGSGVDVELEGSSLISASVHENTARGNDGNGIRVAATSYNGDVFLLLEDNAAGGNGGHGLMANLGAAGDIRADVIANTANGNGCDGLNLRASAGGRLELFGERNVVRKNSNDGIYVQTAADVGEVNRQYDFGGGVLGSTGHNVMSGNRGYELERSGAGSFSARFNYWAGVVPPVFGSEFSGTDLDVSDAFSRDPTLP